MVQLVGGSFLMGSSDPLAREADGEGPVREVVLSAFAMDHVAVSNDDFASFIEATGHRTDAELIGWSLFSPPSSPVNCGARQLVPRMSLGGVLSRVPGGTALSDRAAGGVT